MSAAAAAPPSLARARPAGFLADTSAIAGRALRQVVREPAAVAPYLLVPGFLFMVHVGALEKVAEAQTGVDFRAFQLPVAVIFAVTGVTRAQTVVRDIQGGYFDRLSVTPVRRPALLLGLGVVDFLLAAALTVPILAVGFVVGVRFATGPAGVLVFLVLSGAWALVFAGLPYAIALKTGNAGAVQTILILFFPFAFLTTAYLPRELMTSWLAAVTTYNPMTYILDGLRSLITVGWDGPALLKAVGALLGVGAVTAPVALAALRTRVRIT